LRHPRIHFAIVAVISIGGMAAAPAGGQGSLERGPASLEAAIAEVEAGRRTTPLVGEPAPGGDVPVTFLAKRDGGRVPRIVSDVTGWGEHADGTFDATVGRMTRVGRTGWYALQVMVAPRARIEYLVAYGPGDYRIDPHDPRRVGPPPASEFVTPGYEPPEELVDPPELPTGRLTEHAVESRALGGSRRVIVWTPPGYHDEGRYPVAVFLDARAEQMARVIDWLVARRAMQPIVACFVEARQPGKEPPDDAALRTFLARELPAWMASRYGVTARPDQRAVVAISYGAKDALGAAVGSPPGYGLVGLLIPGRRIGRADIDAIAGRRDHRLRVAILAGRYDQANVATARAVRDALVAAGDSVDYREVPEGHSPRTWLNHLRFVLVSLFGPLHDSSGQRDAGLPMVHDPKPRYPQQPHPWIRPRSAIVAGRCHATPSSRWSRRRSTRA
jgi:enterochelin esterase-like enzyme